MKRRMLVLAILPILVLALGGVAQAWQGRMGGMGDPYGLVADPSDFLTHPAKIAKGEGISFYGDYRFTYRNMFDYDIEEQAMGDINTLDLSGDEMRHDALVGAGFPLGPGRMGLFFNYEGRHGDYDGDFNVVSIGYAPLDLTSDLDAFALRILYGLPLGNFRLGGELGFAYCQEENESELANSFVNWWFYFEDHYFVLPSFAPFDSEYWEIPFKVGIEGMLGPVDLEFTVRAGWIVSGDNTLTIETIMGTPERYDLDGDVEGWRIGGDLWLSYPLSEDLSMPVLVRVDYQEKKRDGNYQEAAGLIETYTQEQAFDMTVGGGVDWEPAAGTRIGAGIYYSYLQHSTDFNVGWTDFVDWLLFDHTDWPDAAEHRGTLVLAGERELSSMVALRMGLSGFLGWATEDQKFHYIDPDIMSDDNLLFDYSMDGFHWGIGASLGATIRFAQFAFEPFLNFSYQSLELSGDGELSGVWGGTPGAAPLERDESHNQWFIGGGCSFLYDLP
jgi:hypothetical protein